MLNMWNKKYEVNTAAPALPSSNAVLTLPPPGSSINLIDIELDPTNNLALPPPGGEEIQNDSETAKMEEQWGSSSDEEKTQISKKEKNITQAKPINIESNNLESTDDDAGNGS